MAVANSKLRSIRHTRPQRRAQRKGKGNYPCAIEAGNTKLNYILDNPHCELYHVFFGESPARERTLRTRCKRLDGAINTITLVQTMIYNADLRQGFIAEPKSQPDIERTAWERKTFDDLDQLAFGPRVFNERSFKRTERSALELAKMGYIHCIQWREQKGAEFRSKPGLKFIRDKLWKVLGVYGLVRAERIRRDRKKGEERAAAMEHLLGGGKVADVSQDIDIGFSPKAGVMDKDDGDDQDIPFKAPDSPRKLDQTENAAHLPFVPSAAALAALAACKAILEA